MSETPWRRVYVDLPTEVDEKLSALAKQRGIPKKKLLADIALAACSNKQTTKEPKK